jgi:hypothetical protein
MLCTDVNPLLLTDLCADSAANLALELGHYSGAAFLNCIDVVRSSHQRAIAALMAEPLIAAAFPAGVPLAPALYPLLESMAVDDLAAEKFGGIPDLRQLYWLRNAQQEHKKGGLLYDPRESSIERMWPRCGCCHLPMTFVGQLDLTDWVSAIHALTAARREARADYWWSGMGGTRNCGTSFSHKWWYIFMCRDNHCDQPSSDAHVWLHNRYQPSVDEQVPDVMDATELKEMLVNHYLGSGQQSLFLPDSPANHLMIEPQRVVGYQLGWEFDFALASGIANWPLHDAIKAVMAANAEIFAVPGKFSLFGAPRSQNTAMRPWTYRGDCLAGTPSRMSPLLSFNSIASDLTCQLYVDMGGDTHGYNLFGKSDLSNT